MTATNITESTWKGFYKIGGAAALAILLIYLIELVVVVFAGLMPVSAEAWFIAFQSNRSMGLLRVFALDIVATFLHAPVFLALFFALKSDRRAYPALVFSITFTFIGMAVYFASNTVFSMLYLSDQYAAATTDAQRTMALTAGDAMLAIYTGTGPFMAYTLYAIAGLMVSLVMWRSGIFSKVSAVAGIVGFILQLGPPPGYGPALFFEIDPILIGIGGVFLLIWLLLVAIKLFQLGAGSAAKEI